MDTLIHDGKIIRPAIGLTYLESSQAKLLGLNRGILVMEVPEGSAANRAGLRGTVRTNRGGVELGDIIVAIDDAPINNEADLFKAIEKHQVNDEVVIKVLRQANVDALAVDLPEVGEDEDEDGGQDGVGALSIQSDRVDKSQVISIKLRLSGLSSVVST